MPNPRIKLIGIIVFALTTWSASAALSATRYVDGNAAGTNKGTSWANAFRYVQDGISVAAAGDEVWVAQGTYNPKTAGRPVAILKDGVSIYGGFSGIETNLIERDPALNPTILDGQNLIPIVTVGATNARLDGFTVRNASGANLHGGGMYIYSETGLVIENCLFTDNGAGRGGGILATFSTIDILNCVFDGNSATDGGGVYNYASAANIAGCDFTLNDAIRDGGAIYNYNADGTVIDDCLFDANTAVQAGGIYNLYAVVDITASIFDGNAAAQSGGGIYNNASDVDVINSLFTSNTAAHWGGGIQDYVSTSNITNCTFNANAANYGGAFGDYNAPASNITNCILWGDTAGIGGKEIARKTIYPAVTYSDVQGGFAGTGNLNADPQFVGGDNYHLLSTSPCLNHATTASAPATDIDGIDRPSGGGIDMGSYELLSLSMDCANPGPNPVGEGSLMQCSISTTGGTPSVDVGVDTCGGAVAGTGPWTYDFTPGESLGSGSCVAAVINSFNDTASDTINVVETNQNPYFTSTAPTSATEDVPYSYTATVADNDIPAQTTTCSKSPADTCAGILAGCGYSFTPTETMGGSSCIVGIRVTDNGVPALFTDQNTTVTIIEDNKAPVVTNAPHGANLSPGQSATFYFQGYDPDSPPTPLNWYTYTDNPPGICTDTPGVFSLSSNGTLVLSCPYYFPGPGVFYCDQAIYLTDYKGGYLGDDMVGTVGLLCDLRECEDGIDNDGDTLIDYPDDPGCFYDRDHSEEFACEDGNDNDGDTLTDYPDDPGCSSLTDNDEYNQPQMFTITVNSGGVVDVSPASYAGYSVSASGGTRAGDTVTGNITVKWTGPERLENVFLKVEGANSAGLNARIDNADTCAGMTIGQCVGGGGTQNIVYVGDEASDGPETEYECLGTYPACSPGQSRGLRLMPPGCDSTHGNSITAKWQFTESTSGHPAYNLYASISADKYPANMHDDPRYDVGTASINMKAYAPMSTGTNPNVNTARPLTYVKTGQWFYVLSYVDAPGDKSRGQSAKLCDDGNGDTNCSITPGSMEMYDFYYVEDQANYDAANPGNWIRPYSQGGSYYNTGFLFPGGASWQIQYDPAVLKSNDCSGTATILGTGVKAFKTKGATGTQMNSYQDTVPGDQWGNDWTVPLDNAHRILTGYTCIYNYAGAPATYPPMPDWLDIDDYGTGVVQGDYPSGVVTLKAIGPSGSGAPIRLSPSSNTVYIVSIGNQSINPSSTIDAVVQKSSNYPIWGYATGVAEGPGGSIGHYNEQIAWVCVQ